MIQRVGSDGWGFKCTHLVSQTSDRTQSRETGSISSKPGFKGHVCSGIISSFYSFDAYISTNRNFFFKELKLKAVLKRLHTDLATAEQEAAIILELSENIKTT